MREKNQTEMMVGGIPATFDHSAPDESVRAAGNEADEFASRIIKRAASLTGVAIDRGTFLRAELKRRCPEVDADAAVASTPIEAGVSPEELDAIAIAAIEFETRKCAALSFAAGIPGGLALVGTVPADLVQYFAHVMRIEQKLAYLYGWQSFLNDDDEVDDETLMQLIALMGVMMEVGGAANSITKFAFSTAQKGVARHIERQALTKTFFYTPMKKVLRVLGVSLTKQTFAKGVSKVVPVVGGVISGGLTYASFRPGAERLRRYLRLLPTSGIDEATSPDLETIRAEERDRQTAETIEMVKSGGVAALQTAGKAISDGATATGSFIAGAAQQVGDTAAPAISSAAQTIGEAFGGALGGLFGQKDEPKI